AIEGGAALGIVEQLADAGAQRPVDQRREPTVGILELLLELATQADERVANQRTRLEALDECRTEALRLRERRGVAGGEAVGPAPESVEDAATERVRRVAGGAAKLCRGVIARRFDDLPLHDLAPQDERQEPLAALAQRACGSIDPEVQLCGGPRSGGEV